MRRAWWDGSVIAVSLLAVPCAGTQAQDSGLRVELSVGPSWLAHRSKAEAAAHLQFGIGRAWGHNATVSLVLDAYFGEESQAVPGCLPGGPCETVTLHPGALIGGSVEFRHYPWTRAVALVTGIGMHAGPSVKGHDSKWSLTGPLGFELETGGGSGVGLVLGFRATALWRNIAGVRWILSPAVGIRF